MAAKSTASLEARAKALVEGAPKATVKSFINDSCDLVADLLEKVWELEGSKK